MKNLTAIITPTWNNEDYTIRCFGSIARNTSNYLIIWIDNGSFPKSRKKVKNFLDQNRIPYVPIYNKENLGFVKATNQGMKKALELEASYLVLENNDTEVYEGWLERMIEIAESNEEIGLVGPITSPCTTLQSVVNLRKVYEDEFDEIPQYNDNPAEYSKMIKKLYKNQAIESRTELAFFSVLIKRAVVEKIGFLSEEFGVGFGDDNDYCIRAKKAGWKLFLAKDVFVFHNHRTTFKSIYSEREIDNMLRRNSRIYKKKHNLLKNGDDEVRNLEKELEEAKKELQAIKKSLRWRIPNAVYLKLKRAIGVLNNLLKLKN